MNKYKLIIFDMDGTLADTSVGIIECHKQTLYKMRGSYPNENELKDVIGAPLLSTYIERFGFSENQAREAVQFYRKKYEILGVDNVRLYPKMAEVLSKLKKEGYMLSVATLKAENFAKIILKNLQVYGLFDVVCGVDEKDSYTKAELIEMCMKYCNSSSKNTLLIGDSLHDRLGADEVGIGFAAVTYGFGFSKTSILDQENCCFVINSPSDILKYLV